MDSLIGLNEPSQHPRRFKGDGIYKGMKILNGFNELTHGFLKTTQFFLEKNVKNTVITSPFTPFKPKQLTVSVMLSLFLLTGCGNEKEQATETPLSDKRALIEVADAQVTDTLSFNGVVRAAKRADLTFRINGRLTNIYVKEGDEVKEGDLLASLDSRDAKSVLESADLALKNAQIEYERARVIFKKTQAISKSDLDAISTRFNLAKNRAEEAKRQLEYTKLKAPFNGIIGRKFVDNHVQIQANSSVLTLHDLSDLEVVINVPHQVVLSGESSTKATATLSAIPGQEFPLELRTFASQPDASSQTYPVALGFYDLKGFRVLPGMSVKVVPITESSRTSMITLPLSALVPDNQGKQFIWIVDDANTTSKRYVDVGKLSKNRVAIKDNLYHGERVIIAGVSSVKEGMTVRPYTDDSAAGVE